MTPDSRRERFSAAYYFGASPGAWEFSQTGGRRLGETRSQAVALLCGIKSSGLVVDLGCGRGELAYYLASRGYRVHAIDWSEVAIEVAKGIFAPAEALALRVSFECADAVCFDSLESADVIVASSLLDHLSPEERASLFARVASRLAPDGIFVVQSGDADQSADGGAGSRSALERLLVDRFPYVKVWVADPLSPGIPRVEGSSEQPLAYVFAIASHSPINETALVAAITTSERAEPADVDLRIVGAPTEIERDLRTQMTVEIHNRSPVTLSSVGPYPYHLSYRWLDTSGEMVVESGVRTRLWPPLPGGSRMSYFLDVEPPDRNGSLVLQATVVQEFVQWFDWSPAGAQDRRVISVVPWGSNIRFIDAYEQHIYSQNGEDGVLRELFWRIGTTDRRIVEIGVEDGRECNSAALVTQYGWQAVLVEGDSRRIDSLRQRFAGNTRVLPVHAFVTRENALTLMAEHGVPVEFDCLSIDIDGNDYWLWEALSTKYRPRVVVIEINPTHPPPIEWVMPYNEDHRWGGPGDLGYGASLQAYEALGRRLGYRLVGVERRGVNAFFLREDVFVDSGLPLRSSQAAYERFRPVAYITER